MIFHFRVFLFTLIFFLFLTWITGTPIVPSWTWYLSTIIPLVVLSVVAAKRLSGKLIAAYLPSVVAFSAPLLLSLIDIGYEERIFVILASTMYYSALLGIYRLSTAPEDRTARAMQNLAALSSLFFVYAGVYGLYLNYDVPLWLLMIVFFLVSTMVAFQTLLGADRDQRRLIFMASLVIGLIFGELIWLLHFWPFGYLTTGMTTLLLFYWLWSVPFDVLREKFSQKRFMFESIVILGLILLLLLSSPWRMVV